jgi:transcriptional regulator with XRE-family HTH domain
MVQVWSVFGRHLRAIRLRRGLRQADVARMAGVSRSVVSLLERGRTGHVAIGTAEAVLAVLGARLDARIRWDGTDLDRLLDANHAALATATKARLERWAWAVRPEVTFSKYGERGRIDLLAWHPATRMLLVVELKTDLVDIQALLGSMDTRVRLAPELARRLGWSVAAVVPAVVFLEDRTTRRRLGHHIGLFDRFSLRGQPAITWVRRPASARAPTGVLWFTSLPNARVVRISGQRVRIRRRSRPR